MNETCNQLAQTNIWINVFSLLQPIVIAAAGFIVAKTGYQKIINDTQHIRTRQYENLEKTDLVIQQQAEVKKALNGGSEH